MNSIKISGFSDEIADDIEEQFRVLNKLNISFFEPRDVNKKDISRLSDEEISSLKEKMKQYHIKASAIGSPIGKVKLSENFEEHFTLFQRVLEIAKVLEVKYIRMFSFFHENGEDWTNEERSEVFKRLKRMIAYAEQQNVILLHENERNIYGDTVDRCLDLMKELAGPHFQFVFDPANFVQCKQDTKYAFECLKPYISYVHIKDALSLDGAVVPAGYGEGNVEFILKELMDSGFDGYLSLEPHLNKSKGLKYLEQNGRLSSLPEAGEGTFTLAYDSLCAIISKYRKLSKDI